MRRFGAWRNIPRPAVLFLLGATALLAGALVYALDRPPASVAFLPAARVVDSGVLGPLAGSLPTFLHSCAFALMSAALLAPTAQARLAACAGWAAVNGLFEVAQHPRFAAISGTAMPGVFDPMDLLAALLGGAAAYLLAQAVAPVKEAAG